jgi:hypothetical protein
MLDTSIDEPRGTSGQSLRVTAPTAGNCNVLQITFETMSGGLCAPLPLFKSYSQKHPTEHPTYERNSNKPDWLETAGLPELSSHKRQVRRSKTLRNSLLINRFPVQVRAGAPSNCLTSSTPSKWMNLASTDWFSHSKRWRTLSINDLIGFKAHMFIKRLSTWVGDHVQ